MAQRVFIKVVGFSDEERHALNTLFRLSEQCLTMYQLWTPDAPEAPKLALLDGQSYEARVEAESHLNNEARLIWVGQDPPEQVWRSCQRPLVWTDVVEAMDSLFQPSGIDFGLDDLEALAPEPMSTKLALIVSPSREERLYLRARLALARLTQADEAESGREAVELARGRQYDVALLDASLPDMDGWVLLRQLRQGKRPIAKLAMTQTRRSLPERVRGWLAGAETLLLDKPPHPGQLEDWLKRV